MVSITRRHFLSAAAGVAAAGFTPALRAGRQYDEIYDVIVIGAGISGVMAAIGAARKGSSVLLIDKMPVPGGSSKNFEFFLACAGSQLQKEKEVAFSLEDMASAVGPRPYTSGRLGEAGEHVLEPDKFSGVREAFARKSLEAEVLLRDCGVRWKDLVKKDGRDDPPILLAHGGGSWVVTSLLESRKKFPSLSLRLNCRADRIGFDRNEVCAVRVRNNCTFDPSAENDDISNESGKRAWIGCRQAVIFATGGFARDRDALATDEPHMRFVSAAPNVQLGATAGALRVLSSAGASLWMHAVYESEKDFTLPQVWNNWSNFEWGIVVDPVTGRRFADEGSGQSLVGEIISAQAGNGGKPPVAIYDAQGMGIVGFMAREEEKLKLSMERQPSFILQSISPWKCKIVRAGEFINGKHEIYGEIIRFETLSELAGFFDIPLPELRKTIVNYNNSVTLHGLGLGRYDGVWERKRGAVDPSVPSAKDHGYKGTFSRRPIQEGGPFYAFPAQFHLRCTRGGVEVNEWSQAYEKRRLGFYGNGNKEPVLTRDKVIPRLYVVGEAAYQESWVEPAFCTGIFAVRGLMAGESAAALEKINL